MAEIFNLVWSWLESGFNIAVGNAKEIWAEIKTIFKKAMDALTSICNNFQANFSYSKELSWVEGDGSGVKSGREKTEVRFGASGEESSQQGQCLPSDPEERQKAWTKMKDAITEQKSIYERMAEFLGKMINIMNEDEQHNNQQETDEKLRQLIQDKETQEMCKRMDEMKKVNQNLN